MAVTFVLPAALRPLADGRDRVRVDERAPTVREALRALWQRHPALRDRVWTERDEMRPHVNVFVGDESIRDLGGLDTPVPDGAQIAIIAAVSGGRI